MDSESEYLAFLDECGDHSLATIDKDFPLFLLALLLIRRSDYLQVIIPEINKLKLAHWDHEGVNLHSHDIRKAQGPFSILLVPDTRKIFMKTLSQLMDELPYELFAVAIHKAELVGKYRQAESPYDLALEFVLERLIRCMENKHIDRVPIIAEARGRNEDNSLNRVYENLRQHGSRYIAKERFQQKQTTLQFQDKRKNIVGIQLADLCAYPCARHFLNPEKPYPPFEIVKKHLHAHDGKLMGLKKFP